MIELGAEAYKKFLRFALQYADPNEAPSSWQETIGFLFGKFKATNNRVEVEITDVLPMDSGSSVFVKVGDYSQIYPELMRRMEIGESIVGWIHSHPGLGIFLSGTDVSTQQLYQRMDDRSIAIVVDPTKINKDFPGLQAFRVEGSTYQPVPLRISMESDFLTLYDEILKEISVKQPAEPWLEKQSVSLEDFELELHGPSHWQSVRGPLRLKLVFKVKENSLVHLRYDLTVDGGESSRKVAKDVFHHDIIESGIISIFSIQAKEENVSQVILELGNIEVTGKDLRPIRAPPLLFQVKYN